jgi:2-polyprenyl-3-methyl-5-hydroxy-6-metoxy-1,4-benzoquinol methylase
MQANVRCQICLSAEFKTIQTTHVFHNAHELNLVKCTQCDLVYLNPQPLAVEIDNIYSEEYFLRWYSTEEKREFSKSFFRGLVEKLDLLPSHGQKLLDVGCGMGFFLEVAREYGWDCKGLDISSYAVQHCRKQLGLDVYHGVLESMNFDKQSFDIITAFDFLEHITDLSRFLSATRDFLKEHGTFVTLVPNYDNPVFLWDKYMCKIKKIPLPNVPEHLTYFTSHTLTSLLRRHNFTLKKMSTIAANDEAEYLSVRLSPRALVRGVIYNILELLGKMTNRRQAILAVAKVTS